MIHKKRLFITVTSGVLIEILNKITPLIILHYAQKKLGIEGFGYAQFGIVVMELTVPFVLFGYNNYGIINIGKTSDSRDKIRKLISNIITLKIIHGFIVFFMVIFIFNSIPSYNQFIPLIVTLSFFLFFSSTELMWVHIGIQKMAIANLFTAFARFTTLILILLLIKNPNDSILYAALSLGSNAIICVCTTIYCLRLYPLTKPSFPEMKYIFKKSLSFAVIFFFITALERIDVFFAEWLFGVEGAGLYSGPSRLNHSFLQIINVIILAFFSEMVIVKSKESLTEHLKLGFWVLSAAMLPVITGIWFVDGDILTIIFSPKFLEVKRVLSVLILSSVGSILILLFGLQILLIKNANLKMIKALATGTLLATFLCWILATHFGLLGIAIGILSGKALAAILIIISAKPYIDRFPFTEGIKAIIPALIMALFLIYFSPQKPIITILSGGFIYISLLFWFNKNEIKKFYSLALNKIKSK